MKVLGQEGLNFIGQKYKELKGLISNKVDKIDGKKLSTNDYDNVAKAKVDKIPENPKYTDTTYDLSSYAKKTDIPKNLSQLVQDSNNRTVTDNEKTNWNNIVNKVDKVEGKGLSANDYDNTAKAKVDAIPASPKYTDTVTTVVDNLTTNDETKALSAKQGKVLNDSLSNKADKSNIGRCKTKGYSSASAWNSVAAERDLEDWIGDFDKRTKELTGSREITDKITAYKYGRVVMLDFYQISGRDVKDVSVPSGLQPIVDFINFPVTDGYLINYRNGYLDTSASDDTYLASPVLVYISK